MKYLALLILLLSIVVDYSCKQGKINHQKTTEISDKYKKLHNEPEYKNLLKDMETLKYPQAELKIKKLMKKYPKNAELYYLYAVMVKNTNPDPLEAIKILEASVKFDDKFGKSHKLLGDLYFIRKDYQKAIKSWEMAIETIKNNANLYYRLGNLYYDTKNYDYAIKYFKKSLALDKNNEWNYYNLGEIYFRIKQNQKKGIEYIKKGLKILPKSKNLNQKLALFYYDKGEFEKSVKQNKEVLKLVKYDNFAIENISDAYMQMKNYEKAAQWLNKILKEQPKSVYYINKMAELYTIAKKFKKALELYEFSYKLRNDSNIKSKIAKLYLIMGNKEKYKEILKELKSSDNPGDISASEYLRMEMELKKEQNKTK